MAKREGKSEEEAELFWQLFHVEDILEMARKQKMTLAEGAFEIGAGLAEFHQHVGEVQEKEVKEKKVVPKLNSLEKQIKSGEKAEKQEGKGLSEYEQIRMRNIRDRLELFNSLDFGMLKTGLKKEKAKTGGPKDALPTREKSRRIKDKEVLERRGDKGANDDDEEDARVPYVDGLRLHELTPLGTDLRNSTKFLSCLSRELRYEDTKPLVSKTKVSNKSKGKKGKKGKRKQKIKLEEQRDEEEKDHFPYYRLVSGNAISPEILSCAAVHPSADFDLVVCGDRSGALCLWLDGAPRLSAGEEERGRARESFANTGRYCAYYPHSDNVRDSVFHFSTTYFIAPLIVKVTHLEFSLNNDTQVISSSADGTLRITDLTAQRY